MPSEPAKGTVVLVHGSGGWSEHREGHYARALSAAGYAALAIDSFGPRGISQTVDDQSQVSSMQMTRDAFAARRFLLERGHAADRMAVMGFSKGGTVALFAADRNFLPAQAERFPVAIAFYPACNTHPRTPRPASVLFMALGEKDDYSGVKPCLEFADAFGKADGKVSVKIYPGAAHAFDGDPANTGMIRLRSAENFMECVVHVEEDGSLTYGSKRYPANDASVLDDMRKSCVKKGATIWTSPRQKEAATRDVLAFLSAAFAK